MSGFICLASAKSWSGCSLRTACLCHALLMLFLTSWDIYDALFVISLVMTEVTLLLFTTVYYIHLLVATFFVFATMHFIISAVRKRVNKMMTCYCWCVVVMVVSVWTYQTMFISTFFIELSYVVNAFLIITNGIVLLVVGSSYSLELQPFRPTPVLGHR